MSSIKVTIGSNCKIENSQIGCINNGEENINVKIDIPKNTKIKNSIIGNKLINIFKR